jgi:hypothetical protein
MIDNEGVVRDLATLAVPLVGSVESTGDPWLPFRVLDPVGVPVEAVSAYFRDLQAAGRSETTLRSYGMDLLRWFRPVDCTKSYW